MLSNIEIRQQVQDSRLISDFNEGSLKHCSYKLRLGKLIQPGTSILFDKTGNQSLNWVQRGVVWLSDKVLPRQSGREFAEFRLSNNTYVLKPNELIFFQTKEKISLPMNIAASYSALDSIAKQGLLLINASVVEPGYEGFLSGVLLNFSSKSFMLKPEMEIVKINFMKIDAEVEAKLTESSGDKYTENLQKMAQLYDKTFLNIERLRDEVADKTAKSVRNQFILGGVLLVLLLAFSTIEPLLYKYIWHDSWVPMNSTYIEMERSMQYRKQMEIIDSLSMKIDSLQIKMEKQDAKKSDTKPQGRL